MLELLYLVLGLLGLVLGSHLIIQSSINLAEHFKISQLFFGLIILSIGTNLPELVVTINASIQRVAGIETSGLVIGQILGSCMGQIALSLGILGVFASLVLSKREFYRDGLMMLGSVLLLFILGFDGVLGKFDAIAFLIFYGFYFLSLQREEKIFSKMKRAKTANFLHDISSLIAGFAILIYASNIVVVNSIILAELWGVTQSFIGVVIVGLGTSLPEVTTAIMAIAKKATKMSVGNLIGSNILDILLVLGIGGVIADFNFSSKLLMFDTVFLFFTSLMVLLLFGFTFRMKKKQAAVLIGIYFLYILMKFLNF